MEEILDSNGIFKSKMSLKAKIKIMESCMIPVLAYGAETLALTKTLVDGLQKRKEQWRELL